MKLCSAYKATYAFAKYAYGDPLPVYARYYDSDGWPVKLDEAASIYIQCQREEGHEGAHLAFDALPWNDEYDS